MSEKQPIPWTERILNTLLRAETRSGADVGEIDFDEPWEERVWYEVFNGGFPVAKLKAGKERLTARQVGALVGHKLAFLQLFPADMPVMANANKDLPAKAKRLRQTIRSAQEKVRKLSRKEQEQCKPFIDRAKAIADSADLVAGGAGLVAAIYPNHRTVMLSAINRAHGIASDQSSRESREFFQGFQKALENGAVNSSGQFVNTKTNFPIYIWLAILSPVLRDNVKSIPELHRVLCNILPSQIVGDQERVRKICNRIQLSFDN